jgi:hypothetical protein
LQAVEKRLARGPLATSGWIRPEAVRSLVEEHATRRDDHHVRLWQLMSLDAWHRRYLGAVSAVEQAGELAQMVPAGPASSSSVSS